MNITNKDFEVIKAAINYLPDVADFTDIKDSFEDEYNIIVSAHEVIDRLTEKKKRDNKRIAGYIAEKRKVNKNYARGYKK